MKSQLFQKLQNGGKEASVEDEGLKRRKEGGGLGGGTQKNRFRHEITICLVFFFFMYRKTYTFNSLLRYN